MGDVEADGDTAVAMRVPHVGNRAIRDSIAISHQHPFLHDNDEAANAKADGDDDAVSETGSFVVNDDVDEVEALGGAVDSMRVTLAAEEEGDDEEDDDDEYDDEDDEDYEDGTFEVYYDRGESVMLIREPGSVPYSLYAQVARGPPVDGIDGPIPVYLDFVAPAPPETPASDAEPSQSSAEESPHPLTESPRETDLTQTKSPSILRRLSLKKSPKKPPTPKKASPDGDAGSESEPGTPAEEKLRMDAKQYGARSLTRRFGRQISKNVGKLRDSFLGRDDEAEAEGEAKDEAKVDTEKATVSEETTEEKKEEVKEEVKEDKTDEEPKEEKEEEKEEVAKVSGELASGSVEAPVETPAASSTETATSATSDATAPTDAASDAAAAPAANGESADADKAASVHSNDSDVASGVSQSDFPTVSVPMQRPRKKPGESILKRRAAASTSLAAQFGAESGVHIKTSKKGFGASLRHTLSRRGKTRPALDRADAPQPAPPKIVVESAPLPPGMRVHFKKDVVIKRTWANDEYDRKADIVSMLAALMASANGELSDTEEDDDSGHE